ncbi:carboxypeptidase regulatory-like domain-containing protein [Streptomyces sp. NPDC090106]|uniref:carboxypeptidase regulatory-like domain-containing protein n=1 Tax=Streptomyces sp. NPDC090106 TaxID=3365946 RepID=UPI003827B56E
MSKPIALAAAVLLAALAPPARADSRELWAAATILPGRSGIVEVTGYDGEPLGRGSRLTLTAPGGARVTDTPLAAASGYRGTVDPDGDSAAYLYTGTAADPPWAGRTFPFVLAVPAGAVPGTRLDGCATRLTDERGTRVDHGTCAVVVGLPEPTLTRPVAGTALTVRPQAGGTAYPGAQITVEYEEAADAAVTGNGPRPPLEVCTATAAADGTWSCAPAAPLPTGPGRLQASAALNGVSSVSEQISVTVGQDGL